MEYKVTDIEKATVNGRRVKIFTLWRHTGGGWVHAGKFSAPERTPDKGLANYAIFGSC